MPETIVDTAVIEPTATTEPTEPVVPVGAPTEPVAPVIPDEPVKSTEAPVSLSDWTARTEDIKFSGVKYGDMDVEVTIPTEIANFAGEKGVDIEAISKELYGSSDFTLSEETLSTLYETFGQWQVDAYMSGIKAKNDTMSSNYKTETETRTANETAAWESTMEIMGGEDRWADLSSYADIKMSDAERTEFNSVMKDGSLYMQQLMIKDLYSRFSTDGAPVAPVILDLEEGANSGDTGAIESALSASAYLDLIKSGEYKKDPAKYDALRRAGLQKGI